MRLAPLSGPEAEPFTGPEWDVAASELNVPVTPKRPTRKTLFKALGYGTHTQPHSESVSEDSGVAEGPAGVFLAG